MPASCEPRSWGGGRGAAGTGRLLHFGLSEVDAGGLLAVMVVMLGFRLWPSDSGGDGGSPVLDSPPGNELCGAGRLFHFGLTEESKGGGSEQSGVAVLVSGSIDGCFGLVASGSAAAVKSSSEGYRLENAFDLRTGACALTDAPREGRRRITGACSAVAATTTELYLKRRESRSRGMS